MERFLLFDSGCSVCTDLARSVEKESGGRLVARGLGEPEIRELLDERRPGWSWEPMLMERDGDDVSFSSGLGMKARLAAVLGPRSAVRVAALMRQRTGSVLSPSGAQRRRLLRGGAVLAGAAAASPALATGARADSAASTGPVDMMVDWRSQVEVRSTRRLGRAAADRALAELARSDDANGLLQVQHRRLAASDAMVSVPRRLDAPTDAGASVRVLTDGNRIVTTAALLGEVLLFTHAMDRPIAGVQRTTSLWHPRPEEDVITVLDEWINGAPVVEESDAVAAAANCDRYCLCYNRAICQRCTNFNWACFTRCCAPCVACIPSAIRCSICLALNCALNCGTNCCRAGRVRCCSCGNNGC